MRVLHWTASVFRANKQRRGVTWPCDCWGNPNTKALREDRIGDQRMEILEGVSQKIVSRKLKKCGCPVMVYAHLTGDNL